jgi:hypothetical protein
MSYRLFTPNSLLLHYISTTLSYYLVPDYQTPNTKEIMTKVLKTLADDI